MSSEISEFQGEHRFLSNFWPVLGGIVDNQGVLHPTVEHAYQASKTLNYVTRVRISQLTSPGKAKRFFRHGPERADWELVKLGIMRNLLEQKFALGSKLALDLLMTGHAQLVEGNTWGDTFWGVCRGQGQNHLGNLLMQRRTQLQEA